MSDTSVQEFYTQQAREARGPDPQGPSPRRKRRRRIKRIAIASGTGLVLLAGALVGGSFLYVNHEVASVPRIHVAALDAQHQPAVLVQGSMNVLLTASGWFPGQNLPTGLIELLHLNADQKGGDLISFPANLRVQVPGFGRVLLGQTLTLGGPSLMIETLEHLTGVRINHYSKMVYSGLPQVVGSMNGVNVVVPYATTSFGFYFHAGVNHITAGDSLAYVRQPDVSQVTRTALQENLFRAILHKIANKRYFVATDWRVLHAVVNAISVDSNLSNSQLERLAVSLGHLGSGASVSIDVPTIGSPNAGFTTPVSLDQRLARKLWRAIRHDSVAGLAQRYPSLVTPNAPG